MKTIKTSCLIIMIMLLASSCAVAEDYNASVENAAPAATMAVSTPAPTALIIEATSTPPVEPTLAPSPVPTAAPVATAESVPTETPVPSATDAQALSAMSTPAATEVAVLKADSAFLPQELSESLYGINIGMDTAEVEAILGPPLSSESTAYYEGFNIRYYYDGCEIAFTPRYNEYRDSDGAYVSEPTDYHDVYEVIVRDTEYDGPRGIKIGDSVEQIFQKLGYPMHAADETGIIYKDNETRIEVTMADGQLKCIDMLFNGGGADFLISFSDGRVESYLLAYYLD